MKLTKKQLHDLESRRITKRALAATLNVSESYLSRKTPPLPKGATRAAREAASQLAALRRQHREKLALRVKKGQLKLETAARRANCSVRTLYRYLQNA